MKSVFSMLLSLSFLATNSAHSQVPENSAGSRKSRPSYETVIEAPAFNSSSRVVLDEEAIQKSKASNLTTLLQTQANLTVSNTNVQPSAIYLRGGDASHILILVDGLPFYDASTTQRTINLNDINVKSIRRIEILKGSQSVLYGGQALSGVIKIETIPTEMTSHRQFNLEAGSQQYQRIGGVLFEPLTSNQGAILRGQSYFKDNRSPVLDSAQTYPNSVASGEVGYVYRGDLWNGYFKASQARNQNRLSDADPATYLAIDAPDYDTDFKIRSFSGGISSSQALWKPRILIGRQDTSRSFLYKSQAQDQRYKATLFNVRGEIMPWQSESSEILVGASLTNEFLDYVYNEAQLAREDSSQKGLFAKGKQKFNEVLTLEGGVRRDWYKSDLAVDSEQIGLSLWDLLKFEYSTGFRAPSLFQLYSNYGNPDLTPERSRTYSATLDVPISEGKFFSATVFDTYFDGLITTQGSYPNLRYYNVFRTQTRGVEASFSAATQNQFRWDLNLGYQEPRDLTNATWLLRRPLRTAGLRLSQGFERWRFGYEAIHNGEKLDRFSSTRAGTLSGFNVSNVFASYQANDAVNVYARGNNIFDVRFEDTRGYYNEGAFWFAGLELSL